MNSKPKAFDITTDGLTLEEDQQVVKLLNKWQGGKLSSRLFETLARIMPQIGAEVVIFKLDQGRLKTLVLPRPNSDTIWPGMLHTPGSVVRFGDFQRTDDNPIKGALERAEKEVGHRFTKAPKYVGSLTRISKRGAEWIEVYLADLPEDTKLLPDHLWLPVDELKKNPQFIQHQLKHIQMAAEYFKQYNQEND